MDFGSQFTKALERVKQQTGASEIKIATDAGLSPTTVTKIKRSERTVQLDKLDQLAERLDMVVVVKLVPKPASAAANS